jgi:hypothetical protein
MDQRASVLKDYAVIDSLVDIVAALLLPVIAHLDSCLPSARHKKINITRPDTYRAQHLFPTF